VRRAAHVRAVRLLDGNPPADQAKGLASVNNFASDIPHFHLVTAMEARSDQSPEELPSRLRLFQLVRLVELALADESPENAEREQESESQTDQDHPHHVKSSKNGFIHYLQELVEVYHILSLLSIVAILRHFRSLFHIAGVWKKCPFAPDWQ
jgi:hypothetical protein